MTQTKLFNRNYVIEILELSISHNFKPEII